MTVGYQPGTWTAAVAGGRAVVSADASLVLDLWPTLLAGGDLVGALLQRSAGEPGDLVLIDRSPTDLVVLVRGELQVVAETPDAPAVVVEARGLRTWAERHVPAGTRLVVGDLDGAAPTLPLHTGVALVGALVLETVPSAAGARTQAPGAVQACAAAKAAVPTDAGGTGPVAARPSPVVPRPASPGPRNPAPPAPGRGKDTLAGPVEADLEHLFEHTVSRPVEAAAIRHEPVDEPAGPDPVRPVPDSPAGARPGDHDGTTITAGELAALVGRHSAERDPGDTPPTVGTDLRGRPSEASYRIGQEVTVVLSTGRELPLSGPVVIGRQPRVDRWSGPVAPTLVTVAAERESDISRTHLRIERVEGRVVVTDLNAANGSVVIRPDGETDLRDGGSEVLTPADTVVIGDGVTVSIRVGP